MRITIATLFVILCSFFVYGMKLSSFLGVALVASFILAFQANIIAQALPNTDPTALPDYVRNPAYTLTGVGVYGGVDLGLHRVDFVEFAKFPTCCTSSYGNTQGWGWTAGLTFDQSLTNWLMLDVRAGFSQGSLVLSQVEELFASTVSGPAFLPIRHTKSIQSTHINLEPALKLRLLPVPTTTNYAPSLYLLAGVGVRYFTRSTFEYAEEMVDNSDFFCPACIPRYPKKRNIITNRPIPSFNQLQFVPFLGVESDIFMQSEFPSHWLIVPYLRYYFGVSEMAQNLIARDKAVLGMTATQRPGSWRMDAAQAGITLKYRMFSLIK